MVRSVKQYVTSFLKIYLSDLSEKEINTKTSMVGMFMLNNDKVHCNQDFILFSFFSLNNKILSHCLFGKKKKYSFSYNS